MARELNQNGYAVCAKSIQNCLNRKGLGRAQERWREVERMAVNQQLTDLSQIQLEVLNSTNPIFKDRDLFVNIPWDKSSFMWINLSMKNLYSLSIYCLVDHYSCYLSVRIARKSIFINTEFHKLIKQVDALPGKEKTNEIWYLIPPKINHQMFELSQLPGEWIGKKYIHTHRINDPTGYMEVAHKNLKESVFGRIYEWKEKNRRSGLVPLTALDELTAVWVNELNQIPIEGFPTFGKSPAQMIEEYHVSKRKKS